MPLYKLTSPSGKSYIGITTVRLKERMWRHKKDANKGVNRPICNAIRRHGFDSFTLTVLNESNDRSELLLLEIEAIKQYNTLHPNGYNYTAGGDGSRGTSHSEDFKSLLSARLKASWQDPEYRSKHEPRMRALARDSALKRKETLASRTPEEIEKQSNRMREGQLRRCRTADELAMSAAKRAVTRANWSAEKKAADRLARSTAQLARYDKERVHAES